MHRHIEHTRLATLHTYSNPYTHRVRQEHTHTLSVWLPGIWCLTSLTALVFGSELATVSEHCIAVKRKSWKEGVVGRTGWVRGWWGDGMREGWGKVRVHTARSCCLRLVCDLFSDYVHSSCGHQAWEILHASLSCSYLFTLWIIFSVMEIRVFLLFMVTIYNVVVKWSRPYLGIFCDHHKVTDSDY